MIMVTVFVFLIHVRGQIAVLQIIIIIHHQNNFFTVYKNLEEIFVSPRDLVVANQVIGILDDLNNESSHLYFEVWKDSQIIDPRDLISDYREKDVSIR